eukprot:345261-Hanusia_phi.AAC.1
MDYLHSTAVPSITDRVSTLDQLCAAYVDPATGNNLCTSLQQKPVCGVDDSRGLHYVLVEALWGSDSATVTGLRTMLCDGSCIRDIIAVYTPLFQQWGNYDSTVASKIA